MTNKHNVTATRLNALCGGIMVLRAVYHAQRFTRHNHEHYAFGVIEAGALAFHYRGEGLVASAGSISLAQPGIPHDGAPAGPDGWTYRMCYLPASALALVRRENAPAPYFRPGVIADPPLATTLSQTHRLLMDPGVSNLVLETRLLALLAAWVQRHAERIPPPPPVPGPEPKAVRRVLEMIDAHFAEDLDLTALATAAGLSPWHLVRVVTRSTGLPPHAHLIDRRIRAARKLLAGPDRLADIAATTGFADQSHFTRTFRARLGLTPGAYRKIVQESDGRPA